METETRQKVALPKLRKGEYDVYYTDDGQGCVSGGDDFRAYCKDLFEEAYGAGGSKNREKGRKSENPKPPSRVANRPMIYKDMKPGSASNALLCLCRQPT